MFKEWNISVPLIQCGDVGSKSAFSGLATEVSTTNECSIQLLQSTMNVDIFTISSRKLITYLLETSKKYKVEYIFYQGGTVQ